MSETKEWYYGRGGEHAGPVSTEKLKKLAATGELKPTDLVWKEGMKGWISAKKVKGLFSSTDRISSVSDAEPIFKSFSSDNIKLECPNCTAKFRVDPDTIIGNFYKCSACTYPIAISAEEDEAAGSYLEFVLPESQAEELAASRKLEAVDFENIKAAMTFYSERIPFVGIQKLGDEINLVLAETVPVYSVTLDTLYENREVVGREKPYRNWSIPDRLTSEENIKPWDYDFETHDEFSPATNEYEIDDSQSIHQCDDCAATGQVTCGECSGGGMVWCPTCVSSVRASQLGRGTGEMWCPSCSGSGRIQKSRRVEKYHRCGFCFRGRHRDHGGICMQCHGAYDRPKIETQYYEVTCGNCGGSGCVNCTTCQTRGEITCSPCRGSGIVTCSRCQGETQIVKLLAIVQEFQPTTLRRVASDHELMTQEKFEEVDTFLEDFSVVASCQAKELSSELEECVEIHRAIQPLLQIEKDLVAESKAESSSARRIAKHSFTIKQSMSIYFEYQHAQRNYCGWLLSKENYVVCSDSPLTDSMKSKLESLIAAWNAGDRNSSVDELRQCRYAAAKDVQCSIVLESYADQIPTSLSAVARLKSTAGTIKAVASKGISAAADVVDTVQATFGKWFGKKDK